MKPVVRRKELALVGLVVIIYMLIIVWVARYYITSAAGALTKRLVQNVTYIILLVIALTAMKCAGKSFAHFGLFFRGLPRQLLIGAGAAAGLMVFLLMLGSVPTVPESFAYMVCSQLLVGISEEAFWRGFVLQASMDAGVSKDKAVFFSSLLFGLSHFPIGGSIAQVVVAFLIGIFFAVLRVEFKETVGLPALAFCHAMINIF